MINWKSVFVGLALIGAAVWLRVMPSSAADVMERPYNPPVGSHWIIDTETSTDDQRPGGPRTSDIKTHAEMTVDEKTADGFRISYVSRGATFEGNAPMLPIMRQSFKALENVTIHATTDLSGKPIRVDNLDEAKTAMRNMVDGMTHLDVGLPFAKLRQPRDQPAHRKGRPDPDGQHPRARRRGDLRGQARQRVEDRRQPVLVGAAGDGHHQLVGLALEQ